MTDRELEDFIKFGEENIVQNGYMVGGGWAKHAITIAKELRDRLAQPEWVGITDLELESIAESCDLWGSDVYTQVIELAATIEKRLKERNT
jgi:hypothetical protein